MRDRDDGGPGISDFASPTSVPSTERLLAVLEQLQQNMAKNDVALMANLQIPAQMLESAFDVNNVVLTLAPKSTNMFRVRQIAYSIPAGATGVLILGDVRISLPAGFQSVGWWQTLNPDDVRQIQSSIAGPMSLVLMGELLSRSMLFR